jgi:predicted glutamine amidotransferase
MCIIAYKPIGVAMPDRKLLKNCWTNNPDGAGYMFATNNNVYIRKGFMNFEGFYASLKNDYKKNGKENTAFVLHFRISTQGGVNKECTHPFPLSRDMEDLRKTRFTSDIGVAHNGIISLTSVGYYKQVNYSDTMSFITDYLSLIIKDRKWYKDKDKVTLVARLAGSKLAIMDGSGTVTLIGEFVKEGDCYFSNDHYKPMEKKKTTVYNWKNYVTTKESDSTKPIKGQESMFGKCARECFKNTQKKKVERFQDDLDDDLHEAMVEEMFFQEPRVGDVFDFDANYCPYSEYGTCSYCCQCKSFEKCFPWCDEREF